MGLYDNFECYGHFYQIVKNGSVIACCRSQLDIIDSSKITRHDFFDSTQDALAIMMNPGTSKPMDENYLEPQIDVNAFVISEKELVPTIPDETQKRLMKVMRQKKWKHVRIINLSDLRQHESIKLPVELKKYKIQSNNHEHSLFSYIRKIELAAILDMYKEKPIIVAWGTQRCLKQYAQTCLMLLAGKTWYGVKANDTVNYHHPLTRGISWTKHLLYLMKAAEQRKPTINQSSGE